MLSDSQIDRYSRQIVVPELGGRAQERLLRSQVRIHGGGDAAVVCASYLVGAGVGTVALHDVEEGAALAQVLALETRNPDCRIVRDEAVAPDLSVVVGAWRAASISGAVLWGGGSAERVVIAAFPAGEACESCLAAVAGAHDAGTSPHILGALLAIETLRNLAGLAENDRPKLVAIELGSGAATSIPFPFRPDCRCRTSTPGVNR